jgi:orotate phosphoribosyltransferase
VAQQLVLHLGQREALLAHLHRGEIAGVGVLVDRSESRPDFGAPFESAVRVSATSYAAEDVPAELAAVPISKPGTR